MVRQAKEEGGVGGRAPKEKDPNTTKNLLLGIEWNF